MNMKKLDPRILAEWDSYRGETITTPRGITFDKADLARRAYAQAEADVEELQERCINRLGELNDDNEHFRGVTSSTVETEIIIATLKAEKFKAVGTAYQKYKYELGVESPEDAGWLEILERLGAGVRQVEAPTPVNDNEKGVGQQKKPRGRKAGQAR